MTDGTMTAAVLYGREDVRVEQIPIPDVGSGEVRIRIGAALTCGTDLKVYRRGYHARMLRPPTTFGHEFAGTIDAVGDGVAGWSVGQRVVAANSAPDDECFFCYRGRPELCEDLLFVNGAYAEYLTLPERIVKKNLLAIPDGLPFEVAALTEPLACVVRGVEETGMQAGDTVAVIGVGPIGLMFVRLYHLAGATVIAVGRGRERLEVAKRLGANEIFSLEDHSNIVQSVRNRANGGRGADVVIECVGRPEVWEQAIAMARKAGTVNLFGGCPSGTSIQLDTARIHYDEVTIKGTFHHSPSTVREALRLLGSGDIPASEFLQDRAKLEDLPAVRPEANGCRAFGSEDGYRDQWLSGLRKQTIFMVRRRTNSYASPD
jgi:L-iditol 2-dehydrogenase